MRVQRDELEYKRGIESKKDYIIWQIQYDIKIINNMISGGL